MEEWLPWEFEEHFLALSGDTKNSKYYSKKLNCLNSNHIDFKLVWGEKTSDKYVFMYTFTFINI